MDPHRPAAPRDRAVPDALDGAALRVHGHDGEGVGDDLQRDEGPDEDPPHGRQQGEEDEEEDGERDAAQGGRDDSPRRRQELVLDSVHALLRSQGEGVPAEAPVHSAGEEAVVDDLGDLQRVSQMSHVQYSL